MKQITAEIIHDEFMSCVKDLCICGIPDDETSNEYKTRSLFYIQGAYDMANSLIKRLKDEKGG